MSSEASGSYALVGEKLGVKRFAVHGCGWWRRLGDVELKKVLPVIFGGRETTRLVRAHMATGVL